MKPLILLLLLCAATVCYCAIPLDVVYENVTTTEATNETEAAKERQFNKFMTEIAKENKQCTENHKIYVHIPCQTHVEKLNKKVLSEPLTPQNLPYYKKKCDQLDQRFFMLHCMDEKTMQEIGRRLYYVCGLMVYSKTDFADCAAKLDRAGSKCFRDWGRYPQVVFTDTGDDEEKEKQDRACKKFFGEDYCLEEEIKNTCGNDEWEKFRDHYVDLNPQLMNCSLPYEINWRMPNKKMVFEDDY